MSKDRVPVEIVAASWNEPAVAAKAARQLAGRSPDRPAGIVALAILHLDPAGKLRIGDTGDTGLGQGSVIGGLLGAGLGLVTAGAGWLRIGGGAVASLAARALAGGLPGDRLQAFGEALSPGSSAILAVVTRDRAAGLRPELAALDARVVTEEVSEKLAEALAMDAGVVYRRTEADGDVVATRTTGRPAPSGVTPGGWSAARRGDRA